MFEKKEPRLIDANALKRRVWLDGQVVVIAVSEVDEAPTVDAVQVVRPELRKAVKLLEKNYERGLNSDFVRDPLALALYQTWREIDGGAENA